MSLNNLFWRVFVHGGELTDKAHYRIVEKLQEEKS